MIKPKLGILSPRLGHTDRGAEIFVYELTKRLAASFEISIWVRKIDRSSLLISDLQRRGISIEEVNSPGTSSKLIHWLYRKQNLLKILEKYHLQPDELEMLFFSLLVFPKILNFNSQILFPTNGLWGALICRIFRAARGIPFIYASLGGIEPLIAKQQPNIYITINHGIERWLKKNYPNLRVIYIPTGVDLQKFSPEGKRAITHLPRPIFITVSALIPEKRVDLVIKAVAKLKKGSLIIVGDGPLKLKLTHEADTYLGKGRYLFQSVGYQKLDEYYRAVDVFTHSAPWELGWSMVHLEAMATNLPVVANREENLIELLKNNGITCDVNDIDEYAKALNKALTYKKDNRPRKAVQNLSWEIIAGQYKACLYKILTPKF